MFFVLCMFPIPTLHASESGDPIINQLLSGGMHYIFDAAGETVLLGLSQGENNELVYRAYPFSTISTSGSYRLSTKVTNQITISASRVTLDLNGNTVTGGIVVNSGLSNVTIRNGTVDATVIDGIQINSGCSSIKVDRVVIRGATVNGINCNQTSDSVIRNCDFTQNGTGLHMNACRNVVVDNCTASRNTTIGFSLLTTTTCTITNCRALGTGFGNTTVTDNTVIGFMAQNGTGNIFDRCIANATQALTTTDFNSIVAGFALRGSEQRSRIMNSEASNATTAVTGVTVPYGIWLENTVDPAVTLTGIPAIPNITGASVSGAVVRWSPDGKYIAVYADIAPAIRIYEWDRRTYILQQVAVATNSPTNSFPHKIVWSGSGKYIVGVDRTGNNRTFAYEFVRVNNTLVPIEFPSSPATSDLRSCAWSPDDQYAAFGDATGTIIRLYFFDTIARKFNFLQAVVVPTSAQPVDMVWSPDGSYLYVAGRLGTNSAFVYPLDRGGGRLGTVIQSNVSISSSGIDVSPDGRFIIVGHETAGQTEASIFYFNRVALTLTRVATSPGIIPSGGNTPAVSWSSDSKYVVITATTTIKVYKFNLDNQNANFIGSTLTLVGSNANTLVNVTRRSDLSPDGQFYAWGAEHATTDPFGLRIYRIFNFPDENIIKNNIVYCNSGSGGPSGIGISGTSICNLIIGNTAYADAINFPANSTNYAFVCNVYNQNFNNAPSLMQNIGVGYLEPIYTPNNIPLLMHQAVSKVDYILSRVNTLMTKFG